MRLDAAGRRTHPASTVFPAVAALLIAISALVWTLVLRHEPIAPLSGGRWAAVAGLVVAFVVSEVFPLRVEIRRETLMVNLSELPLVVGLLMMPAWTVVGSHLVAGALVYVTRRDSWQNCLLNLSLIAIEAGLAALMLVVVLPGMQPTYHGYLAVAIGALLGALVSALAVGIAYHLIGPAEPLLRLVGRSMLSAVAIVIFALVGVTLWASRPAGPFLVLAMAIVLAAVYRTYFAFLRQHGDLARMYTFGRGLTAIGGIEEDWHGVIDQVRDQLNAKTAVLHLADRSDPAGVVSASADHIDPGTIVEDDPLLELAARTGAAHASADRTDDPNLLAALTARRAWDVLVVPLRSGDRLLGYLEVRDRRSRWGRFREDDVRLLETLAGHVATAVDNERLLDTLRYEAYHDAVTGLANRSGLISEANALLADGGMGGLLLIQLDVLNQVTSALGGASGDQLLIAAAGRLRGLAGAVISGRIDGDRFAIVIGPDDVADTAHQIASAMARPIALGGLDVEPHASAGLATLADGTSPVPDAALLLQRAEMALFSSRPDQADVHVYKDSLGEAFRRRFQLVTQFRRAVADGRIVVHYQPKLTLASREVCGVEALVRWIHPEFGLVSPGEFVEAIEATGSIDILLFHVLDEVLAQVKAWSDRGLAFGAAVNLSVRNLLATDFTEMVAERLTKYGVPPELLTLEITESNVMAEPERSLPVLRALHQMGIRLAVDDFGTGYSSLAYLRRLPIDEIKIDKSFVRGMVTDLGDLAIVRAIIDLGHSLGLTVIAEGVEEEAARDAIAAMRCDGVQGFLVSRPLPLERFEAWIRGRTDVVPGRRQRVLRTLG